MLGYFHVPDYPWNRGMDRAPHRCLSSPDRLHHDEFHQPYSASSTVRGKF